MSLVQVLAIPPGIESVETIEGARRLFADLREAGSSLHGRTALELARSLGGAGLRFLDRDDPIRHEAERRLPEEAGISGAMARNILDGMARDWTPDRLTRLVLAEFPDPEVLDEFRPGAEGQLKKAVGGSFALHIGSGNVPGVGTMSMVRSLLVKCPVLLKPGRGDRTLPLLFARALHESDPELAGSLAIVYWPGGETVLLQEEAIRAADRVVAYGGSELIERLRSQLPPTTPLVAYHHRLSVGAVARECLESRADSESTARSAARSVATFDQRGCVSPQIIWVEQGGAVTPMDWARLLGEQLDALAEVLPPGPIPKPNAAALQQAVGTFELRAAAGSEDSVFGGASGTVFYDPEAHGAITISGTGRTVVVRPIEDLSRLPELLLPASRVLQTLALAAPHDRREALAEPLSRSGVTRLTSFEAQPWPAAWWCHDGLGPLQALVRWVVLEPGE